MIKYTCQVYESFHEEGLSRIKLGPLSIQSALTCRWMSKSLHNDATPNQFVYCTITSISEDIDDIRLHRHLSRRIYRVTISNRILNSSRNWYLGFIFHFTKIWPDRWNLGFLCPGFQFCYRLSFLSFPISLGLCLSSFS